MAKNRRKADGTAFEGEFKGAVRERFYVKRLHTMNTGNSGLRQPADFIVVGSKFNYVECKETAGDLFSISNMEQYDLMLEFLEDKFNYAGTALMEYYLVVHFLTRGTYRVLNGQQARELAESHKSLKYEGDIGMTFTALNDLRRIKF